jgi:hypothetical protein
MGAKGTIQLRKELVSGDHAGCPRVPGRIMSPGVV